MILENMGQKGPKSVRAIMAEVKQVKQELNMITTAEYLREKARAEAAEAKILELEAKLAQLDRKDDEPPAWDMSNDVPE